MTQELDPIMSAAPPDRLARLERRQRVITWVAALNVFTLPLLAFSAPGGVRAGGWSASVDTLRVREVVVVDSAGTVRARLGAHLPDAIINGRRAVRGDDVSGLMLYDHTGVERGGYVTFRKSGNVALTLDTRTSQVALFAADPTDGAVARLWRGDDWVELRSGDDGTRLTTGRSGGVLTQTPALSAAEAAVSCREMRSELARLSPPLPAADALTACRRRLPNAACRACLAKMPASR